jgi:hypothetical protein
VSEQERIEKATHDQAGEALCFVFGTVARQRQTTPVGKLLKKDALKGVKQRRDHEEDARQAYSGTNVILTHTGLVIDTEHAWVASM